MKQQLKLTKRATIGLIIGGDLLLLLLGWFLLISPQRATANSIARATEAAQVQIQQIRSQPTEQPKPAAVQQPEIRTANLYALAKAMPTEMDTPNLLLELNQLARSAGVSIGSISPGQSSAAAAATSGFSAVPITLSVGGDFYSLTDFVFRLRTLVSVRNGELDTSGRLYSVDQITLGPSGQGAQLLASVTVNAYVYGGAPVPAPAAPVPGATETGSTETTTTTTSETPAANVAAGP